jgi:hypothetical protein
MAFASYKKKWHLITLDVTHYLNIDGTTCKLYVFIIIFNHTRGLSDSSVTKTLACALTHIGLILIGHRYSSSPFLMNC